MTVRFKRILSICLGLFCLSLLLVVKHFIILL